MRTSCTAITLLGFLVVLGGLCNAQPKDVLGWQESRWGMSNEEIVRAFGPRIARLPKGEDFLTWHADYVMRHVELEGEVFSVFFQMDNETKKLAQVLVRLDEQESRVPRDEIFAKIETMLIHEYGAPVDKTDHRRSSSIDFAFLDLSRLWRFPTTTIELSYGWDNQIEASLLTIRYFPTRATGRWKRPSKTRAAD
jgi:hypothetical protein